MKNLIIFDLDGTLVNSIKDLGTAANFALEKNGFPKHPLDAYPMFVGNGVSNLLRRALPEDARQEETIQKLRADFTGFYNIHNLDYTIPYDGITNLLTAIRDKGIGIAVASNKYQEATEKIVTSLFPRIRFAAIEGQKEGIPVKPDPSIVFGILSSTGMMKKDVLYIGDSGVDMETARRAGVESAGVTWGFRPIEELLANSAGHIVEKPSEILRLLNEA